MLVKRLRRWPNIEATLEECTMFDGKPSGPVNTCVVDQLFRDPHSYKIS